MFFSSFHLSFYSLFSLFFLFLLVRVSLSKNGSKKSRSKHPSCLNVKDRATPAISTIMKKKPCEYRAPRNVQKSSSTFNYQNKNKENKNFSKNAFFKRKYKKFFLENNIEPLDSSSVSKKMEISELYFYFCCCLFVQWKSVVIIYEKNTKQKYYFTQAIILHTHLLH